MDWIALIGNLLFVIVGVVAGFFGSIGLEWWKQRTAKEELKNRIREELELTLKEIKPDYENDNIHYRNFFTNIFTSLQKDLIKKLDVTTYRAIEETYSKIHVLDNISNSDRDKKNYKYAIDSITKTIELLNKHR